MSLESAGGPPRFSFLTTAHGTSELIGTTIDSVLAQTRDDWELVVVDNGYDDAIAAVVAGYDDPRVRFVRQENRRYRGGIARAASEARGEYFCVLDSDDQLMPDFVETISGLLDRRPTAAAVGCDAHLFVDGERQTSGRGYLHSLGAGPVPVGGEQLTVEQVLRGRVPYYTGAVRRQAWDAVQGYSPDRTDVDESVLIWLRLSDRFEVWLLPDRLGRYRVRANSLSRGPENVEEFESSLMRTFEQFALDSGRHDHIAAVSEPLRRLRYHQALRRSRLALLNGERSAARGFAREAFDARRTVRAGSVLAGLTLAPGLLALAHPAKQRVSKAGRRATAWVRHTTAGTRSHITRTTEPRAAPPTTGKAGGRLGRRPT